MTPREEEIPPLRLVPSSDGPMVQDDGGRDAPPWMQAVLGVGAGSGVLALGALVLSLPERNAILPALVQEQLGRSGATNPVTSVLLNFRAYDTLLEMAVLVAAMVAVWSLDRGSREFGRDESERRDDPVIQALARFAVPLAAVTAVYLTWAGTHRPGGAFQAGALLAGTGVLLVVAGFLRPPTAAARAVRILAALGIYVFAGVGVGTLLWTGRFLDYPDGWAAPLMLGVEAALTVSIAIVLVELFVDVPALPQRNPALARLDPTGDPLGRLMAIEGVEGPPSKPDAEREERST